MDQSLREAASGTPLAAMDGASSDPLWLTALVIKWLYRPSDCYNNLVRASLRLEHTRINVFATLSIPDHVAQQEEETFPWLLLVEAKLHLVQHKNINLCISASFILKRNVNASLYFPPCPVWLVRRRIILTCTSSWTSVSRFITARVGASFRGRNNIQYVRPKCQSAVTRQPLIPQLPGCNLAFKIWFPSTWRLVPPRWNENCPAHVNA